MSHETKEYDNVTTKQIVVRKNVYKIRLHGGIEYGNTDSNLLKELHDIVSKVKKDDIVVLNINSYGGSVYTMSEIIDALYRIVSIGCKLEIRVVGCAMSAGLIILTTLAKKANKIEIAEEASIMAHSAFSVSFGKPKEIIDYARDFTKRNKIILKPLKNVLTKKQFNKVIKQEKELWLTGKEFYKLMKKAYPEEGKVVLNKFFE